jgi:mRNA-degrading endonuclease toxin of MazEF toxin-antitoxin module
MPIFRYVLLKKGDANLPHSSLARGTHVMVIDKSRLQEKIGTLSTARTEQIFQSIVCVLGGYMAASTV